MNVNAYYLSYITGHELSLLDRALNAAHDEVIQSVLQDTGLDLTKPVVDYSQDLTILSHYECNNINFLLSCIAPPTVCGGVNDSLNKHIPQGCDKETPNSNNKTQDDRDDDIAKIIAMRRAGVDLTPMYFFGGIMILAALVYIFMVTWIPIPESNTSFAYTGLGFISGTLTTVVTFFFGSSASKDQSTSIRRRK